MGTISLLITMSRLPLSTMDIIIAPRGVLGSHGVWKILSKVSHTKMVTVIIKKAIRGH